MKSKAQSHNKFVRIIMLPLRALSKARDCYVRSMMECGQSSGYGNYMGYPGAEFSALPRSFSASSSVSSGDEDFRELIRAASASRFGNRIDIDTILREQYGMTPSRSHLVGSNGSVKYSSVGVVGSKGFPKCSSVGMGRIDEDEACDFGEEPEAAMPDLKFPRSRSYAVSANRAKLLTSEYLQLN